MEKSYLVMQGTVMHFLCVTSVNYIKIMSGYNFSAFLTVKVAYFSMAVTDKSLQPVNVTLQGNFDVYTIKFL